MRFDCLNSRCKCNRGILTQSFLFAILAFLPSVTGAMYGGCLGASAVLGRVGTLRLGHAILSHLAAHLREDNPKLGRLESYVLATKKFLE